MLNKERQAETEVDREQMPIATTSSPNAAKPNVGCCPIRVQRKRVKGWKMPINTVSVTRPGKWGNPFQIGDLIKIGNGKKQGEFSYLKCLYPKYNDGSFMELKTIEDVVAAYKEYVTKYPSKDMIELKGKNLACFCPLDKPCHADVLLEAVNG